MKSEHDDINIIGEERLDWLLKNQESLENVPEDVDEFVLARIREKTARKKPAAQKIAFFAGFNKMMPAAAAVFAIILISVSAIYFRTLRLNSHLECRLSGSGGTVAINGKKIDLKTNNYMLYKNAVIASGADSYFDMKTGSGSLIKAGGNTRLKIRNILKNENGEFISVYLGRGTVRCSVRLPRKSSVFEIITDNCLFSVKGTEFEVTVSDGNDAGLKVFEGTVTAGYFKKKKIKIRKTDEMIFSKLTALLEYSVPVERGRSLLLKNDDAEKHNEGLKKILGDYDNNRADREKILSGINSLEKLLNEIFVPGDMNDAGRDAHDNKNEKLNVLKLPLNPGLRLNENDTAINSDGYGNIYITSDSSKTVTCIDVRKMLKKWSFYDSGIKTVNTPAVPYKGRIVAVSWNMISVLDRNGKTLLRKDMSEGPSYWSYPVSYNGRLYIPSFDRIYVYDGEKIGEIKNLLNSGGQIYLNCANDCIYFTALNEKKAKKYSLSENRVIWESDAFADRSFNSPLPVNDLLYATDIQGNIYRYDTKTDIKKTVKSDSGIISNLVYLDKYLYFVANNGSLCRIDTDKFSMSEKIISADASPAKDKYLTKKIVEDGGRIYFCCDTGKLLVYDTAASKTDFINIPGNEYPLAGMPVIIGNDLYVINTNSDIYRISGLK